MGESRTLRKEKREKKKNWLNLYLEKFSGTDDSRSCKVFWRGRVGDSHGVNKVKQLTYQEFVGVIDGCRES